MDELAAKAGRLLRGEDEYTRARSEPRVKEKRRSSTGTSCGTSASFSLRVAVSRKKMKPKDVHSNASESALQNGAAEYDNPTYASRLAAERDAPRFRLWVELLYPPMKDLVAAMTREDRALLHSARTISAVDEQRNQAFMQKLKASGAKKRRRRLKSAEMYDGRPEALVGRGRASQKICWKSRKPPAAAPSAARTSRTRPPGSCTSYSVSTSSCIASSVSSRPRVRPRVRKLTPRRVQL